MKKLYVYAVFRCLTLILDLVVHVQRSVRSIADLNQYRIYTSISDRIDSPTMGVPGAAHVVAHRRGTPRFAMSSVRLLLEWSWWIYSIG